MAFQFNLLDVQFKEEKPRSFDSLSTNKADRGIYAKNLRYPADLGTADKAHYAIFTIYEQQVTNFAGDPSSTIFGDPKNGMSTGSRSEFISQGVQDMMTLKGQNVTPSSGDPIGTGTRAGFDFTNTVSQELSPIVNKMMNQTDLRNAVDLATDTVKPFVKSGLEPALNSLKNTDASNFNRKIRRISESVALYLPDTLNFAYNQGYSDVSMYSGKMGLGATAISALDEIKNINKNMSGTEIAKQISKVAGTNLSPFLSHAMTEALGAPGSVIAAQAFGGVQNPMLELIYTSPSFRDFRFDFMFYPRSVKEAEQVYDIINCFKFHSAPEIKPGNAGFFLVPPSIFNIEFFYNGVRNQNLPLLSDCVLTGIEVDYSPNGWSSYEVPSKDTPYVGGTGTPVNTRLTLSFKETVILTKGLHQPSGERVNR